MPPSINKAESAKRKLILSETNITPPKAAITGTDSWTTAACVAESPPSAVYHIV